MIADLLNLFLPALLIAVAALGERFIATSPRLEMALRLVPAGGWS